MNGALGGNHYRITPAAAGRCWAVCVSCGWVSPAPGCCGSTAANAAVRLHGPCPRWAGPQTAAEAIRIAERHLTAVAS